MLPGISEASALQKYPLETDNRFSLSQNQLTNRLGDMFSQQKKPESLNLGSCKPV
jgi:hypothetical protein